MPRRKDARTQLLAHGPAQLDALLLERESIDHRVLELGRDLVLGGLSYADLARLLGVTRQSARQRWGPSVDAWRLCHGPDRFPWDVPGYGVPEPEESWEDQQRVLAMLEAL